MRRQTCAIQVGRAFHALLIAAARLPRLSDPSREHHDRVSRARSVRQFQRRRQPPDERCLKQQQVDRDRGDRGFKRAPPRAPIHAAEAQVPRIARVTRLQCRLHDFPHAGDPNRPAVASSGGDPPLTIGRGTAVQSRSDRGGKGIGAIGDRHHAVVVAVESPNLPEIGRHDRQSHGEGLVQLRRVDMLSVVTQTVRHETDIERLQVLGDFLMTLDPEQVNVRASVQAREIGLDRTDEHEARVGKLLGRARDDVLIDPAVETSDVPDNRPRQSIDVCRRRPRRLARIFERPETDARRHDMDRS